MGTISLQVVLATTGEGDRSGRNMQELRLTK